MKSTIFETSSGKHIRYSFQKLVKHTSLIFWMLWSLVSLYLLAASKAGLPMAYVTYLGVCAMILVVTREDVLSPASICVFISFLSFGLNIPFISAGLVAGIKITDDVLADVTYLVVITVLAFGFGAASYPGSLVPALFRRKPSGVGDRPVTLSVYLLLLAAILVAAAVRLRFHLGEAGVQPALPFAGYIQFVLFEGLLLMSLWFLSRSLQRGGIFIVFGLSLLLCLALTQALLGWRGAIFHMILMGFGVFWYQRTTRGKKPISLAWLILLVLLAGSVLQLGNAVRAERLGGDANYAATSEDFVSKLMTRSQGTTRLARIVKYFGGLSSDNHGLLFTLIEKGVSTTEFIDHKLYRIEGFQSHSVGTSGPGGPYTAYGMIGVAVAYFLLGTFYKFVYVNALRLKNVSTMPTVLYIYLIFALILSMSENFSLLTVKILFAVCGQAYCYDRFLLRARSHESIEIVKSDGRPPSKALLFNFR